MSRTIVDIHVLQTVPPSNVNRDDTGSPKTATFGGVVRARVSSQAWKRATRLTFKELLDTADLGVRTKRLVELVEERILRLDASLSDQATELAEGVVAATGIKLTKAKRTRAGQAASEVSESGYLVFLSHLQLDHLARAAVEIAGADDPAAALKAFNGKKVLDRDHSIDLALFGRMVADVTDLNVDACAQVAHAISVHGVSNEFDYFTAVDDAKDQAAGEDAGAGMIGTVEFNSSTLYRYATIDVDRLRDNLGDATATRRAVEAFVRAFLTSMPTGKQNTFANRTLPDAVVVLVRDSQPVNLVGAFEDAVTASLDHTRQHVAGRRLGERAVEVAHAYGQTPVRAWALGVGDAVTGLHEAWDDEAFPVEWVTLPQLPAALGQVVDERGGTVTVLVLTLAGPLQAWGSSSRFTTRGTQDAPTKSGVVGLLAAACGLRRTDPLEDLLDLRFGVRIDQPGQVLRDFQTARTLDGSQSMPLSYRWYRTDARYLAALEGPGELLTQLVDALTHPVFPLYLGRRSCPPSEPLAPRLREAPLATVLQDEPWQAASWWRRRFGDEAVELEYRIDDDSVGDLELWGTTTDRDQPISFDPEHRQYGWRSVAHGRIRLGGDPGPSSDGLRHEPMTELE